MPGAKTKRPSESQKTKLRASCDGCYLTKIKCNKARPMCSRCLVYGIDCVYSPSSRSGRTKKDPDQGSLASTNDYKPGPLSYCHEQTENESRTDSRSPFLYVPEANLSDNESPYNFNPTILTPGSGATFDQYSLFDVDVAVPGTGMVPTVSPIEVFDSEFWWTDPDTPAAKHENNFPGSTMLPLTSEFLLSSPQGLWNQHSEDQLDFTSYNMAPDIRFNASHSPTTSISHALPPPCNCFASYPQDLHVLRNHSCSCLHPSL